MLSDIHSFKFWIPLKIDQKWPFLSHIASRFKIYEKKVDLSQDAKMNAIFVG